MSYSPWGHKQSESTETNSFTVTLYYNIGLYIPCGSDGKESACSAGDLGSTPGSGRSPGKRNGYHSVFLPGKSCELRRLAGYSPWGHKESNMTEQLHL